MKLSIVNFVFNLLVFLLDIQVWLCAKLAVLPETNKTSVSYMAVWQSELRFAAVWLNYKPVNHKASVTFKITEFWQ